MERIQSSTLGRKVIYLAVLSSLQSISSVQAACVGFLASPNSASITIECAGTGTSGNITNANSTTYVDNSSTSTAGNNTLLQFDGQGRILTNSGSIINNRVINGTAGARGRTAVLIGAATINADTSTLFSLTTTPTAGVTSVKLNTTPSSSLVGQTIVLGRFDAAQGDFSNGEQRLITAVDTLAKTVSFADALTANFAGDGTNPAGYKIVSNFGAGDNVITNTGTISSQILAAEINGNKTAATPFITSVSYTAAVKAITASVEGNYVINNSSAGVISVKHDGIGNALAIEEGGAVTEMTVNNAGLISAERTASLSLVSTDNTGLITPTAISTSFAGFKKQNIGNVNAINTQEEAEVFTLNNLQTGVVRATGDYAGAIYMRAAEKVINNEGLIEYVGTKGYAIGAVSEGGEVRTLELNNSETGIINGDILVANGNALRYYTLTSAGSLDARLNINSQFGQSDSAINNEGQITGNVYLANGTHTLTNEETGVLAGNIDVDQRSTYSVSGNGTLQGTKSFSFENAGNFAGNITIRTDVGSNNVLSPTISGEGLSTAALASTSPAHGVSGFGSVLKVWNGTVSTIDTTTTIKPKISSGVIIKSGTFYKLVDTLFGTALPSVEDSLLVGWSADNTGGALLLGASIKDASSISGVSGGNAKALNALLSSNDKLVGSVLNLETSGEIAKVSEQIKPETNGAAAQAALSATNQVLGLVSNQLSGFQLASLKGVSGFSAGEMGRAPGVWLQGFGVTAEQDKRSETTGYNLDGYGFVLGTDALVGDTDNLRLGVAASYAQSNVENIGASRNKLDIDSYQGTLYASWAQPNYYVNGALSAGLHQFSNNRLVLNGSVTGNHDGWQYTAKVDAGWPLKFAKSTIIPIASLAYSHLDEDAYSEKGAGALSVSDNQTDSLWSGLGVRAFIPLSQGELKTNLEFRGQWLHEFADTAQDTTARFAAGGSSFSTQGVANKRDSANLGASFRLVGGSQIKQTLEVSYDAEVRDGYVGHTGKLTARFDF